jgi:hypothetical protein
MVTDEGAEFRTTGVCFQNLNAYGFGEATDYQKDVANIWLSAAGAVRKLMGMGSERRIDILRGFDGVVRKGEMLVVLGPPGSGCSTLLKTIAGETNGLFIDDKSYFNYQGMLIRYSNLPLAASVRRRWLWRRGSILTWSLTFFAFEGWMLTVAFVARYDVEGNALCSPGRSDLYRRG